MAVELVENSEIQALSTQAMSLEERAQVLVITTEQDLIGATDALGFIARLKKSIEEKRTFFVKPLNEQVSRINQLFKGYAAPLERADGVIRGKVLGYRQEQERIRREEEDRLRKLQEKEQARLAKLAEKKGLPEPPPPPMPITVMAAPKTVSGSMGTVSAKKVWEFEIVDPMAIPREYLMVDESKIRAVVKAGVRNIPGVRVFEVEQLAVRAR